MRPLVRRSLSWISRLSMSLYLLALGLIVPPVLRCILVTSFAALISLNVLINAWVRMGDFLLQFVVPTIDVICGTGSICVEVVPYLSVTVDPFGCNIGRS